MGQDGRELLHGLRSFERVKLVSVRDTVQLIQDAIETRWRRSITRYSTSAFLRAKLGDALDRRGVAPHIYESAAEALQRMRETRSS